jgi:hypothetical protein
MTPMHITATLTRPPDEYGSGWNWAEAATQQWIAAAAAAGLTVTVVAEEVDHPNTEVAIVTVGGSEYVLEVCGNEIRAAEKDASP